MTIAPEGGEGLRAGLDRCGKSRPHRHLIPDCPACSQSLHQLHYLAHIYTETVCISSAVRWMPGVTRIKRQGTAHIPHNTIPSCKDPEPKKQSHSGFKPKLLSLPPQWHTAICSGSPYYDHVKTINHNWRSFSTSKIHYSYQVPMSQPSSVVTVHESDQVTVFVQVSTTSFLVNGCLQLLQHSPTPDSVAMITVAAHFSETYWRTSLNSNQLMHSQFNIY